MKIGTFIDALKRKFQYDDLLATLEIIINKE